NQRGGPAFALPATVAETQAILLSGDRYSANGFHDRINRCDYSLGHSGARSRFEGCFARILARAETGWTSLLHHTDRDRPADPQPAPVTAKSSRKPRHDAR